MEYKAADCKHRDARRIRKKGKGVKEVLSFPSRKGKGKGTDVFRTGQNIKEK